jgi:hypothetical protein
MHTVSHQSLLVFPLAHPLPGVSLCSLAAVASLCLCASLPEPSFRPSSVASNVFSSRDACLRVCARHCRRSLSIASRRLLSFLSVFFLLLAPRSQSVSLETVALLHPLPDTRSPATPANSRCSNHHQRSASPHSSHLTKLCSSVSFDSASIAHRVPWTDEQVASLNKQACPWLRIALLVNSDPTTNPRIRPIHHLSHDDIINSEITLYLLRALKRRAVGNSLHSVL